MTGNSSIFTADHSGRAPRRLVRYSWLPAALLLLLVGCTTESDQNASEGTPPPGDVAVEVTLDEFSIDMPESIDAGTISFEIENVGEMEHSFAIEGVDFEEQLEESLAPNGSTTYTIELAAGTYSIWCPIGNHREQGMEMIIDVIDDPSASSGAPLGDEGVESSEEQAPIDDGY